MRRFLIWPLLFIALAGTSDARQLRGSAVSSFWNGGLVQTSLSNSVNDSGEYIPIDAIKRGRDWATVSPSNGAVSVLDLNSNGFPSNNTSLSAASGWLTVFKIPSSANKPGNYNVVWTGGGSSSWTWQGATVVSNTGSGCTFSGASMTGTNCTAVVTPPSAGGDQTFTITAVASGGPTSLHIYNVNDATAFAAGNVCKGTKFASTVGANFGVIRDLNTSNANFSNVAAWADRTPLTWWNYSSFNYFPASLVTSNTITLSSGEQYTLAFTGLSLTDKVHVITLPAAIIPPNFTSTQTVSSGNTLTLSSVANIVVGMVAGDLNNQNAIQPTATVTNVNSGTKTITFSGSNAFIPGQGGVTSGDTIYFSPMLSVNGTTSVPLVDNTGTAIGTQNHASQIFAHWSTLTYDASLNVWMIANNQSTNSGLSGGFPPEWFTQCANEIGAHPWYVLPPYSMDAPTDYVSNLASYAKANLLAGLIPRFEGPNEDWNSAFFATQYSENKEFPRSGQNFDFNNWYGRAISQLGQTVSSTYGNNRALYKVEACMASNNLPVASAISSGTYNSGTGAVSLTLASSLGYFSGESILVRGVTGTGSVASVKGTFTSTSGTGGTTLNYTIATGLTLTIASGGATAFTEPSGGPGDKLLSSEYVSNGGSAAYNWVTDACPTAYYQSALATTITEIGYAYWYTNGASGAQQTSLVHSFLAGTTTSGFAGNRFWLENTIFPGFAAYFVTYTGTAPQPLVYSMYEGGYASNAGCGYSASCGLITSNAVTAVSQGSTTTLTVGANAWNYICNTASLCTGGQPTASLTFGGGCGLNGLDPAVLSATPTTITVNVNSTGFTGCTTGMAAYDNVGTYVTTFELGVKQNTDPTNLSATELAFLQSFYSNGGRFPAEFDGSDTTDWGKYNPDVYQTQTPVITAVQAFQASP